MENKNINWELARKMNPTPLKDFHDQKDLFKYLFDLIPYDDQQGLDKISWVQAQIFTIDKFLPFMAMHGYTLQKARHKLNFYNIYKTIDEFKEKTAKMFSEMLSNR
jgi:hypothetical protein